MSLINGGCDNSRVSFCVSFCLVKTVREFQTRGGTFGWNHIFRKANQVVDVLAKYGLAGEWRGTNS